jgi:tetratricopeptide (TPR) repeat protein
MRHLRHFMKFTRKTISAIVLLLAVLLIILFHKWVIIQMHHTAAFFYVWRGDQAFKKGEFQQAIDKYKYAITLYPENSKAHYNLANIYVVYEDYDNAVESYEKALEANPDYLNARINLGIVLTQQIVDVDRAISEYKKAINTKPFIIKIPFIYDNKTQVWQSKAIAYYNLGLAYKSKSMLHRSNPQIVKDCLRNAAQSYRNSISIEPKSYEAHYNLGLTLQLLGINNDAIKEYCTAINLEPFNYEAHYNLAILLRQKCMYTESINELEKAGLLLDTRGDYYKTAYIYQVLNDVSQRAVSRRLSPKEYIDEKLEDSPSRTYNITYVHGKVVASDDLDKAIMENMRTCSVCKKTSNKNKSKK